MVLKEKIKENFHWIPAALMIFAAILKFAEINQKVFNPGVIGLENKTYFLGIIELGCVAVFLFSRTMVIGFI